MVMFKFLLLCCVIGVNSMVFKTNEVFDEDAGDTNVDALERQVQILTKQMETLMGKRHHELKLLETNLKQNVHRSEELLDLKNEVELLRRDIVNIQNHRTPESPTTTGPSSATSAPTQNEQLTARWLSETVAELRAEMREAQRSGNASALVLLQHRDGCETQLAMLRTDLEGLESRSEKARGEILELQEMGKEIREDVKDNQLKIAQISVDLSLKDPQPDDQNHSHRTRHNRFLKKQLRDIQMSNLRLAQNQRALEKRLAALASENEESTNAKIEDLQTEQRKSSDAVFNLTRQYVSLDKLRLSMLELLENVENLESKIDRSLPEYKKEISKLEFSNAQIVSEQNLLKEDGDNVKNSMKAVVVSLSNLMDAKDAEKNEIRSLKEGLAKLEAVEGHRKERLANRINKIEQDSQASANHSALSKLDNQQQQLTGDIPQLVKQLATVEREYRDIVNKLPRDCAEATRQQPARNQTTESPRLREDPSAGLYLLSPGPGQPIMTHCSGPWTTVQRRFDGSVDFNRNWEEYATGFGNPGAEFWIGNEALSRLTADNCSTLRIEMTDIYDNAWSAQYETFLVANRAAGYRLQVKGYKGNASDALEYQDGMQFSAIDDDRDISNTHCAGNYEGGWWFSHCQHANLNGRYNLGLTWFDASRNEWIAVKSSRMMVRRREGCH